MLNNVWRRWRLAKCMFHSMMSAVSLAFLASVRDPRNAFWKQCGMACINAGNKEGT